jgi:acyl-coenzyme A thioesterase PaaI-like protein
MASTIGPAANQAGLPDRIVIMALTFEAVKQGLSAAVPMVRALNLEFLKWDGQTAVLRLPDQVDYHNHLGGPHAGAMFTLAESAAGAVVIGGFGEKLTEVIPLAASAAIEYLKIAHGPVTASATMSDSVDNVLAELSSGKRPEFDVIITISDAEGTQTGVMTVRWTLKPLKPVN